MKAFSSYACGDIPDTEPQVPYIGIGGRKVAKQQLHHHFLLGKRHLAWSESLFTPAAARPRKSWQRNPSRQSR